LFLVLTVSSPEPLRDRVLPSIELKLIFLCPETPQEPLDSSLIPRLRLDFPSVRFDQMPLTAWPSPVRASAPTTILTVAVYRNGTFIDLYAGPMSYPFISSLIEDASHSQVLLSCPAASRVFILRAAVCTNTFEDVAFLFRHSKEAFCFVASSESSLIFHNAKLHVTRVYDGSVSVAQFVQTCAIAKRQKFELEWNVSPGNHSLVAMLSRPNVIVQRALDFVAARYSGILRCVVLEWGRETDAYLDMCRISQNEATIIMLSEVDGSQFCFLYPNMDALSNENLEMFVSKGLARKYFENYFVEPGDISQREQQAGIPFQWVIPGRMLTVIFFTNPSSPSDRNAQRVFREVKNFYVTERVAFFIFNPKMHWAPPYCPTVDGFPTFALWKEYDRQPIVFKEEFSADAIIEWIGSFYFLTPIVAQVTRRPTIQAWQDNL
jgi:hypothetical protein